MGLFWHNSETDEEEKGEFEKGSTKVRQQLGDLESEEAIIKDKERFGRVRNSLMNNLRAKYGYKVANRALWRVNRRITEGYFDGKT